MTPTSASAAIPQAVQQWKLGHHIFHLQITVMNSMLDDVNTAVEQRDWDTVVPALQRLADLYDAATASMKFAADFAPSAYDRVIRPSMSPPYLSPGFTGMLNQEHSQMVALLGRLRAQLRDHNANSHSRSSWNRMTISGWRPRASPRNNWAG